MRTKIHQQEKNMEAVVNKEECVGCGACVEICPEVFRLDDDDKAYAYGDVTDENKDSVQEAIDTCPVSAISWEE